MLGAVQEYEAAIGELRRLNAEVLAAAEQLKPVTIEALLARSDLEVGIEALLRGGRFKVGHVALVTAVFPDGSIDIAQYNLLDDHLYSTMYLPYKGTGYFAGMPVSWPNNFVHVKGF